MTERLHQSVRFFIGAFVFIFLQTAHSAGVDPALDIYNQIVKDKPAFQCKMSLDDNDKRSAIIRIKKDCLTESVINGQLSYAQKSECAGRESVHLRLVKTLQEICNIKTVQAASQSSSQYAGSGSAGGKGVTIQELGALVKAADPLLKKLDAKEDSKNNPVGDFSFPNVNQNQPIKSINREQNRSNNNANIDYNKAESSSSVDSGIQVEVKPVTKSEISQNQAEASPAINSNIEVETSATDTQPKSTLSSGEVAALNAETKTQLPKIEAEAVSANQVLAGNKDIAPLSQDVVVGGVAAGDEIASKAQAADADMFSTNMNQTLVSARTEIMNFGAAAAEVQDYVSVEKANKALAELTKLQGLLSSYSSSRSLCGAGFNGADKLCSFVKNPKVQAVQGLMAVTMPILSKATSARESCELLENTNKVGQFGMALANSVCMGSKIMCDTSCATSDKIVVQMDVLSKSIMTVAIQSGASMGSLITDEKNLITGKIATCKSHALTIAEMSKQVLTLASSSLSAGRCKKQLSSGSGSALEGTSAAPIITTADFCANPANASNATCKCVNDPNSEGCLGAFSGNGVKAAVFRNGGQVSGMVSAQQNGSSASLGNTVNSGLTPDQKKALGFNVEDSTSKAGNNLNASADSGSVANGSSAASGLNSDGIKTNESSENQNKSKFGLSFSGFSNGLSGFFGGSKNKNGAYKGLSPQKLQEQELAAKRKIASDQLRAEVSTASGKSNFDKVRNRYKMTTSSLFDGQ